MLAGYIDRAMEQAVYEIMEESGQYWRRVVGRPGD